MGLLDSFSGIDDPQTMGLLGAAGGMLQASGPSRMPISFGQVLGAGLQGYQGGADAATKRVQEAMQQRQLAQLRGLQIQEAQGGLDDNSRARQHADALRDFFTQQRTGQAPTDGMDTVGASPQMASAMPGSGDNSPKIGGPDWMQAYQASQPAPVAASSPQMATQAAPGDPYAQHMATAQQLRSQGFHAEADAYEAAALKFKPKFNTEPRTVLGADGKPMLVQTADDGTVRPISGGYGVAEKMSFQNLGGKTVGVDPYTGATSATFLHAQSPDSVASNALTRDRLNFDKSQAASADDAAMDPLAIRMTAQQYLAGDSGALTNFGRGAQGASNLNAVRLEVAKQANAAGMNGADIAAKMAEFGGLKAGQRTAGVRSASIEIAANEVAQLAPLALEASSKVARSGFLPFGKAQIMFDSNTNNPDMRQFAMANTALVNAYGQAMARGGAATVSDKDHARELLSTGFDQPSYAASVSQLQKETRAAQAAPKQVRKDLSDSVSGRDAAPAAAPAASKIATLSDIAATARASGKSTAEVTAAMRAAGYTIGGQ